MMDPFQKRKDQILEHLNTEIDLLKEYEDKLRTENDPSQQLSWRTKITEIKGKISEFENELKNWSEKERIFSVKPIEDSSQRNSQNKDENSLIETHDNKPPKSDNTQLAKEQISEAILILSEIVDEETKSEDNSDEFYLLRLQLLTSTLLSKSMVSNMPDIHEVNRLYLEREKLKLTPSEFICLLRMLVADNFEYKPGWYWFKDIKAERLELVILDLAFSDKYDWVRQQAFKIASSIGVQLPDDKKDNILWSATSDSIEVRRAALSYLGKVGGQEHLTIVCSAFAESDKSVIYQAKISKLMILARTVPDRAFKELIDEETTDFSDIEAILNEFRDKKEEISSINLIKALELKNSEIRLFAVKELLNRKELNEEIAKNLKEDHHDPIKAIAYQFLIENTKELEPFDITLVPDNYLERHLDRNLMRNRPTRIKRRDIVLSYYKKYSFNQLKNMLDWTNYYGSDVYLTLGLDHFEEFGKQLREDLQSNFEFAGSKYYEDQLDYYKSQDLPEAIPTLLMFGGWSNRKTQQPLTLDEKALSSVGYEKKSYIKAGLIGLTKNGSPEDVEFGRRFLNNTDDDIRIEAVKILERWGNQDDIANLINIAKNTDGLLKEKAAQSALKISNNSREVISDFLLTEDEILVSLVIAELLVSDEKDFANFLKPYLYNSNDIIRNRVMAFYIFSYDNEELTNLLIDYTNKESYFYDVVSAFDRILHAPDRIQLHYRRTVTDLFFGLY